MHARFESNLALLENTALAVQLRLMGPQGGHVSCTLGDLPSARELVVQGTAFDAVRPWLEVDPRRRAYFIESDLTKLCALLSHKEGSALLSHPQASLHTQLPDVGIDVAVAGDPNDVVLELAHRFRWEREDRSRFRHNLRANLCDLPHSQLATELWGRFDGVPAIICGAGPSLDGAIPAVNRARGFALVLAGGSALRSNMLQPHLGAAIDPIAPPAGDVPLFFRHRTHPGARGFYVSGANGYPEVEALDAYSGIPPSGADEGVSVTCFLLSIARQLGCSPLILVGVDLGVVNGREYADSVGLSGTDKWAQWAIEQAWIERNAEVIWGMPEQINGPRCAFDFSAAPCPDTTGAVQMLDRIEALESVIANQSGTGEAIIAEVELECLLTS